MLNLQKFLPKSIPLSVGLMIVSVVALLAFFAVCTPAIQGINSLSMSHRLSEASSLVGQEADFDLSIYPLELSAKDITDLDQYSLLEAWSDREAKLGVGLIGASLMSAPWLIAACVYLLSVSKKENAL